MSTGGGGSQTVTNKTELSPEQRKIMTNVMGKYMPGDKLPDQKNFDWNEASYNTASNYVAPFSADQNKAFEVTRQTFGAENPTMDAAKGLTAMSANPTGTKISSSGMGWDNGNFDYDAAVSKSMNPYMTTGLTQLDQNFQANLNGIKDSFSKSYGGSRQAVAEAAALGQHGITVGDYLRKSYGDAQDNANTMHNMGASDIATNNSTDQQNATRMGQAGGQLADIGKTSQEIRANDINALSAVGSATQQQDQLMRDTALEVQRGKENYGLTTAQAMMGFAPPSSTTQTSKSRTGGSQIFGSALGALGSVLPMMMSDEKSKENIEDADPETALDRIRKLKPISYNYKGGLGQDTDDRIGFTAQDAEKAGIKTQDVGGYKHVDMQSTLEHVVHAISALDARVSKLGGKYARAA